VSTDTRKPTSHHPGCFGCGTTNEHGLALRPHWADGEVRFEHVPPAHAEGGPGIAHGGYLSALADEVMSMVAADHAGGPAMTRRIQVDYHAPVLVGVPLTVRSWVEETGRRSIVVKLEATGGDPERTCFTARGVFLPVPREVWVKAMHASGRAPGDADWGGGDPSSFLRMQMNGGLQEIFRPELLRRPLRVAAHLTDAEPADWTIEADMERLRTAEGEEPGWEARFHGDFRAWQRLIRGMAGPAEPAAGTETRFEGRAEAFAELAAALDYRRFS
jgi:acyl-coenzyme A thioesterase PaaI-like protein